MKYSFYFFLIIGFTTLNQSCKQSNKKVSIKQEGSKSKIKHAQFFSISNYVDYKKITLKNPWDSTKTYATYYLVSKDTEIPKNLSEKEIIIRTPIENCGVLATPYIGLLSKLNATDKVIAVGESKYIYNKNINNALTENQITEVGAAYNLNTELVLNLKPNIVFTTGNQIKNKHLAQLQDFGIPIIYGLDWMENTPLARAEWLKFIACFTEQEDVADAVFNTIENRYMQITEILKNKLYKPTKVLVGQEWKGVWNAPGGSSYFAQLLQDAGADYHWKTTTSTGSLNLSFEEIYDKQADAAIWLNPGLANSITQILNTDSRLKQFKAIKNKDVYSYTNKLNEIGANSYWENAGNNPDIVLSDLIKILHPDLLPDYELYYYRKIQ